MPTPSLPSVPAGPAQPLSSRHVLLQVIPGPLGGFGTLEGRASELCHCRVSPSARGCSLSGLSSWVPAPGARARQVWTVRCRGPGSCSLKVFPGPISLLIAPALELLPDHQVPDSAARIISPQQLASLTWAGPAEPARDSWVGWAEACLRGQRPPSLGPLPASLPSHSLEVAALPPTHLAGPRHAALHWQPWGRVEACQVLRDWSLGSSMSICPERL